MSEVFHFIVQVLNLNSVRILQLIEFSEAMVHNFLVRQLLVDLNPNLSNQLSHLAI